MMFGAALQMPLSRGAQDSGLKAQVIAAMGQRPWQNNGIQYSRPVRAG